ncbi:AEC family transporter [Tessaracoccus sp. Z1128]
MVEILIRALSLVAIVAIGYGIKRLGWVKASDFGIFSKIVLRITLPCALATSFNSYTILPALLLLVVIGFVVNAGQQAAGYWLNRRNGPSAKAFGIFHSGTYNIGAFSMPYISGFMGSPAMVYTAMFDVGNSLGSAGVGYGWGMSLVDQSKKTTVRSFLKIVFSSPIFVTYLVLVVMRLAHITLPDPIIVFTSTVGAANPFLAMLMIGVGLEIRLHRSRLTRAVKYLAMRYTFAILLALGVWYALPLARDIRIVLVMLLFAPVASMVVAFSEEAGLDVETSAFFTSMTILVAIVVMPTILLLLG